MKTRSTLSILAAFALPLAVTSCGGEKDKHQPATDSSSETSAPTYTSHAELIADINTNMNEMMASWSSIKDMPSAEAFAAKFNQIKPKLNELLEAAKALGEPTAEDKAAFIAAENSSQEKYGPALMAMMINIMDHPDADAIKEVIESVKNDEEMANITDQISDLYAME